MDEWKRIAESVYRQIMLLGPIYVSQFILICLIVYRLTKIDLSQEEKKKLSYSELAISFIASFIPIVIYGMFLSISIYGFSISLIYICLLYLLFTPFTFTVLRVALENKLSEQQKHISSIATIPLTVYVAWVTTILAVGPNRYGRSR
jgi:cytochrome bd-type quinol oxidase subunit 2